MVTYDRLKDLLHYDPESGVWTWRDGGKGRSAGAVAGCATPLGYRVIGIGGAKHQSHRLAFLYMTGHEPEAEIDHINGVPGDDRWENLRPATPTQNRANKRACANNKLGVKGVHQLPYGSYRAQIQKHGRMTDLGVFETVDDAAAAYWLAAQRVHGEYARAI